MSAVASLSRPYVLDAPQRYAIALVHPGWLAVVAALGLSAISVYAIDVALQPDAHKLSEMAGEALKQLAFIAAGAVAAACVALPHYRLIGRLSWVAMAASVALLVVLILPGVPESIVKPVNGARAWISVSSKFKLQPAELAKISFVLCTAQYLRFRRSHRRFFGLVPVGLIAAVPLGLIMLQPDLGTVLLFIPTLFAILLAAGARLRHLVIIVAVAGMAAPVAYPFLMPHQKARIVALIHQIEGNKDEGAYDINYQSFTAQRLAGSGEIAGNSDDHARALIRFNRLPESHNDFVFSVICARFGFLGGVSLFVLYMVWIGGALWAAALCKDPFGRLVCVGLAGFIAAQVVVNVGMNIGLLPIIGITLPFLSYGGSSMITVWLMTGLVVNIAMRKPVPPFRPSFEYEDDE
jgi:cell division protein FtsW (lipid II flippase)